MQIDPRLPLDGAQAPWLLITGYRDQLRHALRPGTSGAGPQPFVQVAGYRAAGV